jgi:hypothetical protein
MIGVKVGMYLASSHFMKLIMNMDHRFFWLYGFVVYL